MTLSRKRVAITWLCFHYRLYPPLCPSYLSVSQISSRECHADSSRKPGPVEFQLYTATAADESITFCFSDPHRRQLWSLTVKSAMVSHTRTQFGRRAFSVCCGPDILNNLPTNLRLIDSHAAFRRALKTRIFNTAFNS